MLETVALEARHVQISVRILQNRDFQVGGKSGWYLVPAQELQGLVSFALALIWGPWEGILGKSWGVLDGLEEIYEGLGQALGDLGEALDGFEDILGFGIDF